LSFCKELKPKSAFPPSSTSSLLTGFDKIDKYRLFGDFSFFKLFKF